MATVASPSQPLASTPSPRPSHRPPLAFPPSSPFRRSKPSTPSPSASPLPHPPPATSAAPPSHSPPVSPAFEGSAVPQYLRDLAMSSQRTRYLSREPSLPSIMSVPRSRPTSPSVTPLELINPTGSARTRQGSMSNSIHQYRTGLGLHVSSAAVAQHSVSGRGRNLNVSASLRAFEEGVGHYERVRSPSLRGHSRRGSWSSVDPLSQSTLSARRDAQPAAMDRGWSGVWGLGEEDEEARLDDEPLDADWLGDETIRDAAPRLQPNGLTSSGWTEDHGEGEEAGVWEIGERLGVGTLHQGALVRDLFSQSDSMTAPLLEVIRQVGMGSYAVVYLVREVLYDPYLYTSSRPPILRGEIDLTDPYSSTPRVSSSYLTFSSNTQPSHGTRGPGEERDGEGMQIVYGRDFALKCLSKRDLSEELLILQRGEAELHRALPMHPNIVALHRALETPSWLFLVIEYCPGQDLFYWLEQARDSEHLEPFASRTNSTSPQFPPLHSQYNPRVPVEQQTPPSPSLLAAKADDEMLSRRRIRLISRMFVQMCDAVQACHAVGVCHRDIKPENFIVVDERAQASARAERSSQQQQSITVKITDWGLGTHLEACDDFDCGSKPYMAYECRNNLHPTYDPVQADVWSLGIVLLNLLYHRCPWADPIPTDLDFSAFRAQPVAFLLNRFEGMTEAVAVFLASRVFCEVNPSIGLQRVTAGHFGTWTKDLLDHLGGGQAQASASEATIPMSPSSARGSSSPARMPMMLDTSLRRSSTLAHSMRVPHSPLPTVPDAVTPDVSTPHSSTELDQYKMVSPLSSPLLDSAFRSTHQQFLEEQRGGEDEIHSTRAASGMLEEQPSELPDHHERSVKGQSESKTPSVLSSPLHVDDVKGSPSVSTTQQQLGPLSSRKPNGNSSNKKSSLSWRERLTNGGHAGLEQLFTHSKTKDVHMCTFDVTSAPAKLEQFSTSSPTNSGMLNGTDKAKVDEEYVGFKVTSDHSNNSSWFPYAAVNAPSDAARGPVTSGVTTDLKTRVGDDNYSPLFSSSLPGSFPPDQSIEEKFGRTLHLRQHPLSHGQDALTSTSNMKKTCINVDQALNGLGLASSAAENVPGNAVAHPHKSTPPTFPAGTEGIAMSSQNGPLVTEVFNVSNTMTISPPPTTGKSSTATMKSTSSKGEGKTKLASLLTSFKRFNQSAGHSGSSR